MSKYYEAQKENYFISTVTSKLDVDVIYNYLSQESYWAKGIPRDVVEKSIENSLCFGVYCVNELTEQIGFARLVTDKATFAYLGDVFILPKYRGKGLSKWLMQTIDAHPEVQGLRRWLLGTRDAHGLYEQFGWKRFDEETSKRFMQKHNPDVYKEKLKN
jgi:GNAT superfamily N-acetyltransferase